MSFGFLNCKLAFTRLLIDSTWRRPVEKQETQEGRKDLFMSTGNDILSNTQARFSLDACRFACKNGAFLQEQFSSQMTAVQNLLPFCGNVENWVDFFRTISTEYCFHASHKHFTGGIVKRSAHYTKNTPCKFAIFFQGLGVVILLYDAPK